MVAAAKSYTTPILSQLGPAPKDPLKNIQYRKRLLYLCEVDPAFRREIWMRCSRDFVFWCDAFVWTLATKLNRKHPRMPFVLFEIQEKAALSIIRAIGLEDRLVEKSRDMGATWLIICVFVWLFIFREDQSFLIGSRKQEFVDKSGDPKTLFFKVDFILEHLPWWMRPPIDPKRHRKLNHIENPANKSVIDGESTNENFGAGDRRTAVLLDEFALVEIGYRILAAVGDVTDCVIYNSTPLTASGAYYDVLQKLRLKHPDWILRLHWSDHPYKRIGLYRSDRDGKLELLDDPAVYPKDYEFIKDGLLRSFAYDARERRSPNRQIMAQQWDIDYLKSGWQFFDAIKLEELLANKKIVRPPTIRGEILLNPDWRSPKFTSQHREGRLMLWYPLPLSGQWSFTDVGIACDIAAGSGGDHSSNSSASIVRRSTGEKIGEWTDCLTAPNDFARIVLAIAKWFNNAMISWERNGPNGVQFGKIIKDSGYTNLYKQKKEARFDYVESKEPGWWTSDENKPSLLGTYAEALWSGAFTNHSEKALEECGHYVQNGNSIEHSRSLAANTEDPTAIGMSHGDRVIADALAFRMIEEYTKQTAVKAEAHEVIPVNCALSRRRQREAMAEDYAAYTWD